MKKAQITIFIIIGIILLISAGMVIYFTTKKAVTPVKRVVAVPGGTEEVYDYVVACINQLGRDAINIIGLQGGYIEVPIPIARTPNAFIPNGPFKTVMWYYEGEDRTPSLEFMQREIAVYIKDRLQDCVGNFEPFAERFEVVVNGSILPIVTLTDEDVVIEVKWPLLIKTQDRTTTISEFITTFQVRLKAMWELADKFMKAENQNEWLEGLTIDLMASNPDIPVSGMEFRCGTRRWHLNGIKSKVQRMLYYLLPYARIEKTTYPPPIKAVGVYDDLRKKAEDIEEDLVAGKEPKWPKPEEIPEDVFEMNRMRFDIGLPRKTDLKASLVYQPEWGMLINAQPNDGGVLSTNQVKGARKYLRFLCINQYHFAYDLIYPVKLVVKDDKAFGGEGFIFQMAFPVIIEDNEGNRAYFGLRRFQSVDITTDFCTNFGTQELDVRALGLVPGGIVAEELEGANITYRCMNQECILGETFNDGSGAIRLHTLLPQGCANPTIIASKEGYLPASSQITQQPLEIVLTRLQKMNYTLAVHPYNSLLKLWQEDQTYTKFSKNQHASLSISLKTQPFDQFKEYPANFTTTLEVAFEEVKDEVELVFGDAAYDIDILLMQGDKIVGGYHAENLTITYDELAGKNHVVFHVVEWRPIPTEPGQEAKMFTFLYENGQYLDGRPYWQALKPTFETR